MVKYPNFVKLCSKLFAFTVITGIIIALGLIAENNAPDRYSSVANDLENVPKYVPTEFNTSRWNVIFDQHSHTIFSDGSLTPRENLLWHMALGYNVIALTDHMIKNGRVTLNASFVAREIARTEYNDSIKVMIGTEWHCNRVHMNLIFPPNTTRDALAAYPTLWSTLSDASDSDIKSIINITHYLGGLVTINHYPWSLYSAKMVNHPSRQNVYDWGADFIEVISIGGEFDLESYEFCQSTGIGMLSGTDMHSPGKVKGWTMMNVSSYTEEAIFETLKNRQTHLIYNNTGTSVGSAQMEENPAYKWLKPLILVGQLFQSYDNGNLNLDWSGIGILVLYMFGGFMILECVRWMGIRLIVKFKEKKQPTKIFQ